jgi:NTE family protein
MRGLAHIGILKALNEAGLPVAAIAGTSMGGLVGAAFAAGVSPQQLQEEIGSLRSLAGILRLLDWWPGKRALSSGRSVMRYFGGLIGDYRTFDDLKIPLALSTCDIETGEEIVLRKGPLLEALNATMALPGVFDPVKYHGRVLVDGGLVNNVPADVARSLGADIILAVDVSFAGLVGTNDDPALAQSWRMINDVWRSQTILMRAVTDYRLRDAAPDILVRPSLPEGVSTLRGMEQLVSIVSSGERAGAAAVPRLRAALAGEAPPPIAQ